MSNRRMRRVNGILREVIADECRALTDPRLGFLTITGVSASPDLRNATVYYSVLGDERAQTAAAAALSGAAPRIRAAVGGQVRMKYLPALHFQPDPALEHGRRIERILRGLEQDSPGGEERRSNGEAG